MPMTGPRRDAVRPGSFSPVGAVDAGSDRGPRIVMGPPIYLSQCFTDVRSVNLSIASFTRWPIPIRRVIVERLSRGPATVSELAHPLPMSLSAVVQHLQVLQVSGLVRSEKVGRIRTCRIDPAALRPVERWIGERRSSWERRFDRLGEYLAEGNDDPRGGKR
jgi:DNA-binding transcriptional ArsR family regulator